MLLELWNVPFGNRSTDNIRLLSSREAFAATARHGYGMEPDIDIEAIDG
jgi:hypothetical protein